MTLTAIERKVSSGEKASVLTSKLPLCQAFRRCPGILRPFYIDMGWSVAQG